MSVIYILWLREMKRYLRSRVQIVASLGQPILYLIVLGFGLGPVFQRAGNGNYLQFVSPGVIGMTVLFSSIFSGLGLLWDRQFGFLKETLVAPVPRLQIMIGRTLGGATVAVVQGLLVTIVCVIAGFRPVHLATVPLALCFMLLIATVFAGLGVAVGSSLQDMQGFQLIMNFLVMPLFLRTFSAGWTAEGPHGRNHGGPSLLRRRRHAGDSAWTGTLRRHDRLRGDGCDRRGLHPARGVPLLKDRDLDDDATTQQGSS